MSFTLDRAAKRERTGRGASPATRKGPREKLRLTMARCGPSRVECCWGDDAGGTIESRLSATVARVIVAGEAHYRASVQAAYEWQVQRKAELEETAPRFKESVSSDSSATLGIGGERLSCGPSWGRFGRNTGAARTEW